MNTQHPTALPLVALLLAVLSAASAKEMLPLAGTWRFALDPKGTGDTEQWFNRELTDTVSLPGPWRKTTKVHKSNRTRMSWN